MRRRPALSPPRRAAPFAALVAAVVALTACGGGDQRAEAIDSTGDAGATTGAPADPDCAAAADGQEGAVTDGAGGVVVGQDGIEIGQGDSVVIGPDGDVEVDTAGPEDDGLCDLEPGTAEGDDVTDDPAPAMGGAAITADEVRDCTARENIEVTGTDLVVELTGQCGAVSVDGAGNEVTVADARSLSVSGTGHRVEVTGSTDAISVAGTGHDVNTAGDPPVEDTSVGSAIG
jgi:hypothetical protein